MIFDVPRQYLLSSLYLTLLLYTPIILNVPNICGWEHDGYGSCASILQPFSLLNRITRDLDFVPHVIEETSSGYTGYQLIVARTGP